MSKSTRPGRRKKASAAGKPSPHFPLPPHPTGRCGKKVRGTLHYFGTTGEDPKGEKAIEEWLRLKDCLLAGGPRPPETGSRSVSSASGSPSPRIWRRFRLFRCLRLPNTARMCSTAEFAACCLAPSPLHLREGHYGEARPESLPSGRQSLPGCER